MNHPVPTLVVVSALLLVAASSAPAVESDASPPKGVTISVYDTGFALVSELRSVTLSRGENRLRYTHLPPGLDPDTVSYSLMGGGKLEVLEQEFRYDLGDIAGLLDRRIGQRIEVGLAQGMVKGTLLRAAGEPEPSSLAIRGDDGSVTLLPDLAAVREVVFPASGQPVHIEPTLVWRAVADADGPRNLRLGYAVRGLDWNVTYEAFQRAGSAEISLAARAHVRNGSGGRFQDARVKLVTTEKGETPELFPSAEDAGTPSRAPSLRYAYGADQPAFERLVASPASLRSFEVPRAVTLEPRGSKHVQLWAADKVPVNRFFVYDGVKFDRFQRNRRNDWNYGTEYHTIVESYLQFSNSAAGGLGKDLPPGSLRLYQEGAGGAVDLVGQSAVPATASGRAVLAQLGPARGLRGERERTGYTEIAPLHEYEESFEIRLTNDSPEDAEVRVVEHAYRWSQFEVVKADTEYVATGPQTIEFRPLIKAGGKRSVHYSVRYRW